MLFYKLFQFKGDLAAILKRYCCHGNMTYKLILAPIRLFDLFLNSNQPTILDKIVETHERLYVIFVVFV